MVYPRPSRFIAEIDPHYLDGFFTPARPPQTPLPHFQNRTAGIPKPQISIQKKVDVPAIDLSKLQPANNEQLAPEMVVHHPTFGTGKITAIEGQGANKRARIYFARHGVKVLMLKFAKLYRQTD